MLDNAFTVTFTTVIVACRDAHIDSSICSMGNYDAECGLPPAGIDYLNIAAYSDIRATASTLSKAGVLVIEGLQMDGLLPGAYTLTCLPLKFKGLEAAPVRCILTDARKPGVAELPAAVGSGRCKDSPHSLCIDQ